MSAAPWTPAHIGRRWWRAARLNDLSATREHLVELPAGHEEANLVSSLCHGGLHAPALDLDHRAHLVPSSTPGHSHLYIDELLTWSQYRHLLRGLYRATLIDASVYWRSLERRSTHLRPPGVAKTKSEHAAGSLDTAPDPRTARRALRAVKLRVLFRQPLWVLQDLVTRPPRSYRQ